MRLLSKQRLGPSGPPAWPPPSDKAWFTLTVIGYCQTSNYWYLPLSANDVTKNMTIETQTAIQEHSDILFFQVKIQDTLDRSPPIDINHPKSLQNLYDSFVINDN